MSIQFVILLLRVLHRTLERSKSRDNGRKTHEHKKIMPKNTSTKVNAIKIIESNREKSSATLLLPQEHKMLQNYNVILRIYVAFMIYSNFVVHRQCRHRYSRCHSRSSYRIHTQTFF